MVEQFALYANGKKRFPKKLTALEAPAGKYKVKIQVDGLSTSGIIELREDPMLLEKGW